MNADGHIDDETKSYLKPHQPTPGRFYILPKIHKTDNPGRPPRVTLATLKKLFHIVLHSASVVFVPPTKFFAFAVMIFLISLLKEATKNHSSLHKFNALLISLGLTHSALLITVIGIVTTFPL